MLGAGLISDLTEKPLPPKLYVAIGIVTLFWAFFLAWKEAEKHRRQAVDDLAHERRAIEPSFVVEIKKVQYLPLSLQGLMEIRFVVDVRNSGADSIADNWQVKIPRPLSDEQEIRGSSYLVRLDDDEKPLVDINVGEISRADEQKVVARGSKRTFAAGFWVIVGLFGDSFDAAKAYLNSNIALVDLSCTDINNKPYKARPRRADTPEPSREARQAKARAEIDRVRNPKHPFNDDRQFEHKKAVAQMYELYKVLKEEE
jgi:hypothetical protein